MRLKAIYSVGDLAELTGLSRASVLRMLRAENVLLIPRTPKRGQKVRVALEALASALPDLAASLRLVGSEAPRRRAGGED